MKGAVVSELRDNIIVAVDNMLYGLLMNNYARLLYPVIVSYVVLKV